MLVFSVLYATFLLWKFGAMVCYVIRVVQCCFQERHISFECNNSTAISFSLELELAYLSSRAVNFVIFMVIIATSPTSLRWKALLRKLACLPVYWNFMVLCVLCLSRYVVILVFATHNSAWIIGAVTVYGLIPILLVILVGVLNFFPIRHFQNRFSKFTYKILQATVLVFCVEALVHFGIIALQLAFDVSGLDDRRDDFHTAVSLLDHVVHLTFLNKVGSFLSIKRFCDSKDILKGPDFDIRCN